MFVSSGSKYSFTISLYTLYIHCTGPQGFTCALIAVNHCRFLPGHMFTFARPGTMNFCFQHRVQLVG